MFLLQIFASLATYTDSEIGLLLNPVEASLFFSIETKI